MGRRCCVPGCLSTSRLPEHRGVTYHTVPLDTAIRQIWIRNCRLTTDKPITKSVLVCSRHFRRADFHPQRSGKYLLKQRVCPTVFSWAKLDPAQVEAELNELKAATAALPSTEPATSPTGTTATTTPSATATAEVLDATSSASVDDEEDTTKATVEAKVAQIMAEAAELNASAKGDTGTDSAGGEKSGEQLASGGASSKFEAVSVFNPGARLEAQDFGGVWHVARIVEVDNDDREVLIRFERSSSKTKAAPANTEEWIPMNSSRLRQKVTKHVPVFAVDEKCMARWLGPRKFPGTVKKVLANDKYEILFDDGYVKNVRAVHMTKIAEAPEKPHLAAAVGAAALAPETATEGPSEAATPTAAGTPMDTPVKSGRKETAKQATGSKGARKRYDERKDWRLLDISKLDLASLNLPEIPRDGEWTCHWVNDQPIGREGYLVVGEHRKPTVVVEDWRLPPGWVKHMYQRSNLLGKWDVILVSPTNKRFRSKADLKLYLEEINERYNPDVYDFSIHRRRAKDINAYVFTPDYTPQQLPKSKSQLDTTLGTSPAPPPLTMSTPTLTLPKSCEYMETPVATPMPPMELLTSPTPPPKSTPPAVVEMPATPSGALNSSVATPEDGYAYIGGLKVQIVDNLFRCPQEGCLKNFRKENHLQIHVKHYHQGLKKLLGQCPKMQELAEKRTHPTKPEPEHTPRNQMSNQEFFAKLHQQDVQHTRPSRKQPAQVSPAGSAPSGATATTPLTPTTTTVAAAASTPTKTPSPSKRALPAESPNAAGTGPVTADDAYEAQNSTADLTANSSQLEQTVGSSTANESLPTTPAAEEVPFTTEAKRARLSPSKRIAGPRKSNRQRTTKRYLTAGGPTKTPLLNMERSFGYADFDDHSRQSLNATPEAKRKGEAPKRRKVTAAPETPLSSVDSPMTVESRSSPMQAPSSSETDGAVGLSSLVAQQHKRQQQQQQQQYIKENGEVIKIVRMRQEEIINCLCGYGEEDGLMIQCELCLCWQHGFCNGVDKEADVPENYVCYKCRNPERGRSSARYRHEQEWLYEGKLPTAHYHSANPASAKRFQLLQKSHMLCGNLVELKQFMHSLRVKMSIAANRAHPKLYLWAHKWDDDKMRIKIEKELAAMGVKSETPAALKAEIKDEAAEGSESGHMPNVPQPEAPIDPVECQHRLLEHIKVQQDLATVMLNKIEQQVDELERDDDLVDLKFADVGSVKEVLSVFMKELDVVKQIARINQDKHAHKALLTTSAMK